MKEKHNVIMAGIGGRGVMVAALTLARAALEKYPYVTWLPSMTTAQRGGPCEATVVFANYPVASPLVWRPEALVIMETSQLKPFIPRLRPGGVLITESAGLEEDIARDDIRVVKVPALARAVELTGDTQAANLVLLGAYLQVTGALPPELVEKQLEERFAGREDILSRNLNAFREGLALAGKA